MEDKKITKIGYDFDPSNVSMFEMSISGDINKQDLTKMNPNIFLGQGRKRREIIARVIIFLRFRWSHEVYLMYRFLHCHLSYQATQRYMGVGVEVGGWPETEFYKF